MPWYFLAREALPEQATEQLRQVGIIVTDNVATEPEATEGISFYTEEVDGVLAMLGLDGREVSEESSGLEGVSRLVFGNRRVKPRAARRPRRKAREGVDAFASSYLEALQQSEEIMVGEREKKAAEVDRLTKELSIAAADLERIELRLAATRSIDEEFTRSLAKEYETINSDIRVHRLATTEDLLMIETIEIVIEKDKKSYAIGKLRVVLGLLDGSVKVELAGELVGPTAHPLVSATGLLYLGRLRDSLVRYIGRREFALAIKLVLDLLSSSPRENMLARSLEEWPKHKGRPLAQRL